jgi:hypothetical protein
MKILFGFNIIFYFLCGTLTDKTYELVGKDELPAITFMAPNLLLDFFIEATPHWRTSREPYTMRIVITDFKNTYETIKFNDISLLVNNTRKNFMKQIAEVYIPTEGRSGRYLTESELTEFSECKTITLFKDKSYRIRDISLHFSDLGFKYKDVDTFQIEIDMEFKDFENNITNGKKVFTFVKMVIKRPNSAWWA